MFRFILGLLPAKKQGDNQIAVREVIIDHSEHEGPKGLFSLSGVKLTTSRLVAEKVLNKIFDKEKLNKKTEIEFPTRTKKEYGIFDYDWDSRKDTNGWKETLKSKIENESVIHLQDLLLRRTTIGDNPQNAIQQSEEICKLFGWDKAKTKSEIDDLKAYYKKRGLSITQTN